MRGLLESGYFWLILTVVSFLTSIGLTVWFWSWLHSSTPTGVSNSETLRNVGLLIGGLLAFVFAGWRAWVAERQANAARLQAQTALHQADTAQQSLLNERYQRGAEMLGSNVLVVRMGGIYALKRLAEEHPAEYHIQVMDLFCAFARNPTAGPEDIVTERTGIMPFLSLREDIQAAVTAIGHRSQEGITLEGKNDYVLNLTGACLNHLRLEEANLSSVRLGGADLGGAYLPHANLSYAGLAEANLSGTTLSFADFSGSILRQAKLSSAKLPLSNLSGATLDEADLSSADLHAADLSEATLYGTILSGTDFSHNAQAPAKGLTQDQLDGACAADDNPPNLARVVDVRTGRGLEWRSKPRLR